MKKMFTMILFISILCACGKATVEVKEGIVVEYGSEIKVEELTEERVTLKEVKDYDAKKIGEQKVIAVFVNEKEKEIEEEVTLEVKDTKKPEIKLKKDKVEITESDKFDPVSNIESVKDPVDGDIKKSDDKKLTKHGYLINSDVDNKKAGNYTVKITAFDKNGNNAESSYKVTVKEKPQESAPVAAQPSNNAGSAASSNAAASGNTTSSNSQTEQLKRQCEQKGGTFANNTCTWSYTTPEIDMSTHVHDGPAVEGMYFDTDEECEAWAIQYQEHQAYDLGNPIGAAWGARNCSCGKVYITGFY